MAHSGKSSGNEENCEKEDHSEESWLWQYIHPMTEFFKVRLAALRSDNSSINTGLVLHRKSKISQKENLLAKRKMDNISGHFIDKCLDVAIVETENSEKGEKAHLTEQHSEGFQSIAHFSLCPISCPYLPQKYEDGKEKSSHVQCEKYKKHPEKMIVIETPSSLMNENEQKSNLSRPVCSDTDGWINKSVNGSLARDDSISLWDLRKSLEITILPASSYEEPSTSGGMTVELPVLAEPFHLINSAKESTDNDDVFDFTPLDQVIHQESSINHEASAESTTNAHQKESSNEKTEEHSRHVSTARERRKSFAKGYFNISSDSDDSVFASIGLHGCKTKEWNCKTKDCDQYQKEKPITYVKKESVENRPLQLPYIDDTTEHGNENGSSFQLSQGIETISGEENGENMLISNFKNRNSRNIDDQQLSNETDTSRASDSSPGCSTTCSVSPISMASDISQKIEAEIRVDDTTSTESLTSSAGNAKSGSIRTLARIFRRSSSKNYAAAPSFCGYSLDRDYCVDQQTDRIFKSFLKPDVNHPISGSGVTTARNYSHRNNDITQLRRQVMRKQYSDSIAVYYGQRMRRWRVKKQRSDSVNCPVDRAVLRRQDRIEEEFDPGDINERLTSPNMSRKGSVRTDRTSVTVTELKEWRRSQQDD